MDDTRLRIAMALADDGRCILDEMLDELPALPHSHFISQAYAHLNEAIISLNKAYTPADPTDGDAA